MNKKICLPLILLSLAVSSCTYIEPSSSSSESSSEPTTSESSDPTPSSSSEEIDERALEEKVGIVLASLAKNNASLSFSGTVDKEASKGLTEIKGHSLSITELDENNAVKGAIQYDLYETKEFSFFIDTSGEALYNEIQKQSRTATESHDTESIEASIDYLVRKALGISIIDIFANADGYKDVASLSGSTVTLSSSYDPIYGDKGYIAKDISFTVENNALKSFSFKKVNSATSEVMAEGTYTVTAYDASTLVPVVEISEEDGIGKIYSDKNKTELYYLVPAISDDIFLPDIEKICTGALDGHAKTVTISDKVRNMMSNSFKLPKLETIYYDGNLTDLCSIAIEGDNVFARFTTMNIKDDAGETVHNNTHYADFATKYEAGLTVPDGVTSIKRGFFYKNKMVSAVTLPATISEIEDYAFAESKGLTSVTLSVPSGLDKRSVTKIGDRAFYHCDNLATFSNYNVINLESIGNEAFAFTKFALFVTYNKLTSIGDGAFLSSGITSIRIPNTVDYIGEGAFNDTDKLEDVRIVIDSVAEWLDRSYSFGTSKDTIRKVHLIDSESNNEIIDIVIPNTITDLPEYAFYNCTSIRSISYEDGTQISEIPAHAFENCTSLLVANIPASVNKIDVTSYDGCRRLAEVINLSSLDIDVSTIEKKAECKAKYGELSEVKQVVSSAGDSAVTTIGDFAAYSKNSAKHVLNYYGNDSDVVIPEEFTTISHGAFYNKNIRSVNFENDSSVTDIQDYAFAECYNLESVVIPANTYYILDYAFANDTKLATVTFESANSNLEFIGTGAFYNCSALTAIDITVCVTGIGKDAFRECRSLREVNFAFGSHLNEILSGAFYNCASLYHFTITKEVETIGEDAFGGINKIAEVVNKTQLEITAGSEEFGGVAKRAYGVIDNEDDTKIVVQPLVNNIVYYDKGEEGLVFVTTWFDTSTAFEFLKTYNVTEIGDYAFEGTGITILNFDPSKSAAALGKTKEEFEAMKKGTEWYGKITVVNCSDGTVQPK